MSALFVFPNDFVVIGNPQGDLAISSVSFVLDTPEGWRAYFCQQSPIKEKSAADNHTLYAWSFSKSHFNLDTLRETISRYQFRLMDASQLHEMGQRILHYHHVDDVSVAALATIEGFSRPGPFPTEFIPVHPQEASFQQKGWENPLSNQCFSVLKSRVQAVYPEFECSLTFPALGEEAGLSVSGCVSSVGFGNKYTLIVPRSYEFRHGVHRLWSSLIKAMNICVMHYLGEPAVYQMDPIASEKSLKSVGVAILPPTADFWRLNMT